MYIVTLEHVLVVHRANLCQLKSGHNTSSKQLSNLRLKCSVLVTSFPQHYIFCKLCVFYVTVFHALSNFSAGSSLNLSCRSFRVKCDSDIDNNLSYCHTSSCGVSVSAFYSSRTLTLSVHSFSLPFLLTITVMQMTLSSFSFHPLNFDSSISHLKNALQQISSWMTANLLTLNSSKTEFFLIGLKNQLANIHNSSLDTSHSAWNIGFIFDEHFTFSDQITPLS